MSDFPLKVSANPLLFRATYVTSESTISCTITNLTNKKIRFDWRKFSKEEEEFQLSTTDIYELRAKSSNGKFYLFSSDTFIFEEFESEIWPRSTVNLIVRFRPQKSGTNRETVYLTDAETGNRIPIILQGECLPPLAQFSVQNINVEHIFLDNSYQYLVYLNNVGHAPLNFALIEKETNLQFDFSPKEGFINVGESMPIQITLYAVKVGQFNETFEFKILGTDSNYPYISLHGRVIGPSFTLDVKKINFNNVSLGFVYNKKFHITNTSEIPLDYQLHVEKDKNIESREVSIYPDDGIVEPKETKEITVEFIPVSVQDYSFSIVMTNNKFSQDLYHLPVYASCNYPVLELEKDEIDAGELYYGYQYDFQLVMVNKTKLIAKYEYLESLSEEYGIELESNQKTGLVDPQSTRIFPFTITLTQLGKHEITRKIKISGVEDNLLVFKFKAVCIGPTLEFSTMDLNFGDTRVLKPKTIPITIKNTSLIFAKFTSSFLTDTTVFSIGDGENTIPPGQSRDIEITATLDDVARFDTTLQICVQHLTPITIPIKAKGVGNFIVPSIPLDNIDLGHLFTNEPFRKEFVLENQGRRALEVRWITQKPSILPPNNKFTYSIEPDHALIGSHQSETFAFILKCPTPCSFECVPQCSTTIKKQRVDLFAPHFTGDISPALLEIEKTAIEFYYVHDAEKEEQLQLQKTKNNQQSNQNPIPSKELMAPIIAENSFSNKSPMPFNFTASVDAPFSLSENHFELQPGERKYFQICFDPSYKEDFSTQIIEKKICLKIDENPQQYFINLKATLEFPNIQFSETEIDFGTLSKSTEQTHGIKIKNQNNMRVEYYWQLLTNDQIDASLESKIFDVYPIRGILEPDAEEDVFFSFYAAPLPNGSGSKYSQLAVCHVIGGPDYLINLKGGSASFEYTITPKVLDFGYHLSTDLISAEISLRNKSDFSVSYVVHIPKNISFTELTVEPMRGSVSKGEQQTFSINFLPGSINNFSEFFFIKIGQFDEERIDLRVNTYYPHLDFSLPRVEGDQVSSQAKNNTHEELELTEQRVISDQLTELFKKQAFLTRIKAKTKQTIPKSFSGFIISMFELNIGSFMLGNDISKTFQVTFCGSNEGSFDLLTKKLAKSGFSFQQTQFRDVKPNEPIDVTINFTSANRKETEYGDISYEIPVVMNEEFGYLIKLSANISAPMISISQNFINFETAIIGETKIVTIQLQNLNMVSVEYTIKPAEQTNVVQRNVKSNSIPVFLASPTHGILPPASFQNIDVAFTPAADKPYSMQLPICIRYNNQTQYVQLKGCGEELKIQFNPEHLVFKKAKAFCPPEILSVEMTNPTTYPIEIYSKQFDGLLRIKQLSLPKGERFKSTKFLPVVPSFSKLPQVKKEIKSFGVCVIVHGPPKSGKTEISQEVSRFFGGIPILNLEEVWENMAPNSKPIEYIAELKRYIANEKYAEGFVVDGLVGLPEPNETDQFLSHAMKQKGVPEEIATDPLLILPHKENTAAEQCFYYIQQVLEGHYLFYISLNVTEQQLASRLEHAESEKKNREIQRLKTELAQIFAMTEVEYEKLSDDQKFLVDKKREDYRNKLIATDEEIEQPTEQHQKSKSSRQSSSKTNRKPRKSMLPQNPSVLQTLVFQYTQGSLVNTALEERENYHAIDIDSFLGRNIQNNNDEEEDEQNNSQEQETPVVDPGIPAHTPKSARRQQKEPEKPLPKLMDKMIVAADKLSMKYRNVLVIDGKCTIDEQSEIIKQFLPSIIALKEKAFSFLISPPRSILEESYTVPTLLNSPQPKMFTLKVENIEYQPEQKNQEEEDSSEIDKEKPILAPRWHLEPGESVTLKVAFNAMAVGHFEQVFEFGLLNASDPGFRFSMEGDCDYPDLDRNILTIFQKTVPNLTPKVEQAFVTSQNEFQFSPSIVMPTKSSKASQALFKQMLSLVNPTNFNAEVTCAFVDKSMAKNTWIVEPSFVNIPANGTGKVLVGFNPQSAEIFKNTLQLFIKDNPDPLSFNFSGEGCVPTVELSTLTMDYDRILVNQEKTLTLELKNTGKIPAYWRIKGGNVLGNSFTFNAVEGIIPQRKSFNLEVKYSSSKPFQLKKAIQLDIFDKSKIKTFSSNHIAFNVETFDANFDLIYPKGFESIDFGEVKINKQGTFQISLKSRSKYPLMYKFTISKASVRNFIKIDPMDGGIQPDGKPVNINFTCQTNKTAHYENAKGISLQITDSVSGSEIANVPLPFSADIIFSSFKLDPEEASIDFGPITTNIPQSKSFSLQNTCPFPIDFTLVSTTPEDVPVEPPDTAKSNNPRDKKKMAKATPTKSQNRVKTKNGLVINDFVISPVTGTIHPNESANFLAEVCASKASSLNASFAIKISDAPPEFADGVPFKLSAVSYSPLIDTNFDQIFNGLPFSIRADLAKSDINTFLVADKVIHFANTIVNMSSSINMTLTNPQPISCVVDLVLKQPAKSQVFSIPKKQIELKPNSSETFPITFSPKTIASFSVKFDVNVKNGNSLSFTIEGNGAIPQVVYTYQDEPLPQEPIKFGQVLVGVKKKKEIIITNTGILPAPVTITAPANPDFDIQCENKVTLEKGAIYKIPVIFQPAKVRHVQIDLKLSVFQNKELDQTVTFIGDGNQEEILFEGLPNDDSDLIFADTITGSQQKITFKMRSVSQSVIRYTWSQLPDFVFAPKVGHIKPGQVKVVSCTFLAGHAVKYNGLKAILSCQKITLDDPYAPDWDSTMTETKKVTRRLIFLNTPAPPAGEPKNTARKFPPHGRKVKDKKQQQQNQDIDPNLLVPLTEENADDLLTVTDTIAEPSFTASKEKHDVILKLFAAADVIKYTIDTTEIEFPATMMFQKRIVPIKVANTSQISFQYHWFTFKFQSLHGDYAASLPSPFTVTPTDGVLKAGKTQVFQVEFKPEEVDEFSGSLRCEIPFLTQIPPPEIKVTGLSRRPICHFNVEASDYISNGRRLPEFTQPLPKDIRVVEISAKRVNERTVRRIEVINPTATPYEFSWTRQYTTQGGVIECETQHGLISSGKSTQMIFSFQPTATKIVESLWVFQIPTFSVKVELLIVGKVIPM